MALSPIIICYASKRPATFFTELEWGNAPVGMEAQKSKCPSSLNRKHNARDIKASSEVTPHRVTATKVEWFCKGPDVEIKGTQQRTHKQTHTTEVTKFSSKVSKR